MLATNPLLSRASLGYGTLITDAIGFTTAGGTEHNTPLSGSLRGPSGRILLSESPNRNELQTLLQRYRHQARYERACGGVRRAA
jgi:hypothetical protein